jgi:K+-sensing histidine kinase KdpD
LKNRTAIFFYLLGGYVLLQFAWWGYHLIELTQINRIEDKDVSRKVLMILSEGLVFFLIIMVGLWQIRKSIKKEFLLSERQRNFLLSVTHELKTPLASNKLFLQTLQKRDFSAEQRNDLLEKAITENVRLEGMIDNILNATRLDHNALLLSREHFSLVELVRKIVTRFEKIYNIKNISFPYQEDLRLFADVDMVETILTNLIENAAKYAGREAKIELTLESLNGNTYLHVSDDGPGVPLEIQKDIFKKFVRVGSEETRSKKGSGLGLYIAREFALLNDIDLYYQDNQPKGANFVLNLKK